MSEKGGKSMSESRRAVLLATLISLVASAPTAIGAPQIIKGPYLQNMTQSAVTIMWETDVLSNSTVHYLSGGNWLSSSGPAGRTIHEIRLSGFSASQAITYYVESTADSGGAATLSSQATFRMAPPTGTPFRMCVWGDNQDRPEVFSQHVARMIVDQPDLLLACGDVVSTGSIYAEWENRFLGPLRPLIQHTPMIVAIGNHEGNAHWFYDFLAQPGNEHWFSYAWGNAYFVIVDTNFPFAPGSEQYNFIQQALLSPEAQSATWLFVAHHHPGYSEVYEENIYAQIRAYLIPMYEAAGVDINFHGHIHDYERGEFTPPETGRRLWQVQTSGAGGTLWTDEFDGDWEQIDLVILNTYHYCTVDVGATDLTLRAIDIAGTQIDTFTVQAQPRDGHPPGGPRPAGPTQWDFNAGTLTASYGVGVLEFNDGSGGPTAQQTVFGTTADLGLPPIAGQVANVMRFPRAVTNTMGFRVRHGAPANGGGAYVNEFTLVFDVLIPQSSFNSDDWLGVFNTNCCNENDADVFVRLSDGAIGIGGSYAGQIPADAWRRVALVLDVNASGQVELIKYINGTEVGRQNLGGIDGRWSLYTAIDTWPWFHLFTDDTGDTSSAYINSLYFVDRPLTGAEIAGFGTPDADGISPAPCPGDVNGDAVVDLTDLATLLAHFGAAAGATPADGNFDGDGDVDLADLTQLLAHFGDAC
jgi:hypothetical protein